MQVMFIGSDNTSDASSYCIVDFKKEDFLKVEEGSYLFKRFQSMILNEEEEYQDENGYEAWDAVVDIWKNQGETELPCQVDYVIVLNTWK